MSDKKYSIYALRNKVSGEIGYIGQTNNIAKRFKEHLAHFSGNENISNISKKGWGSRLCNPRRVYWIFLNRENIEIQELQSGILTQREANERESFFILKFSKEGHPLTNVTSPLIFNPLRFNRWSSSEALQRYPGGYRIASSDLVDFLSVGKFLFLRDVFFDKYQMYVHGKCQFDELTRVYDQMKKGKELAISCAKGIVKLSMSCGGAISKYTNFDEKILVEFGSKSTFRNRCSSAYDREENKFSWINNCMNICAISVATSGRLQCSKRAVIYNVKGDLNLLSLKLRVLALSKINTEQVKLLLSEETEKRSKEKKNRLNEFNKTYLEIEKLKETLESNQISIENYIIKLGITLIKKLGSTPEELIFD